MTRAVSNDRSGTVAPVIALLTDFGTQDPFVGVMKGVILARCPGAAIVDLTHGIASQDVAEGAFWLERSFRWFATGTIFVAVVDPSVGTARRALVVEAHQRIFIGPDNGVLGPATDSDSDRRSYVIDVARLGLPKPSRTFHGRDVFAPVAAELASRRIVIADVGAEVAESQLALVPSALVPPALAPHDDSVSGVVVTIDRFGNLITNIPGESIAALEHARVEIGGGVLPFRATYADVATGERLALVNAFGTVEVAVRDGSAARSLGLGRGACVLVRRGSPEK